MKPPKDVLFGFVLDACQGVVEFDRRGTGTSVAVDLLHTVVGDGTDGGDDGRRSAAERFVSGHGKVSSDLPFDDIVDQVRKDWLENSRRIANEQAVRDIIARYTVEIEGVE